MTLTPTPYTRVHAQTASVQFCGRLLADAEVRAKPTGQHGQMMPVLCLELEPDDAPGHVIHAEQVFPSAAHQAAENRAHTLRKGARVTVETPASHLRLVLHHCHSMRLAPGSSAAAPPAQQELA